MACIRQSGTYSGLGSQIQDRNLRVGVESVMCLTMGVPQRDLKTTASQNIEAVPRRARIQGSCTFVSLNSRLESNKEEEEIPQQAAR